MAMNTFQLIEKFNQEDNPGHLLNLAEAIGREPLIRYIEGLYGPEQASVFSKLEIACNHAMFMRLNNAEPPTVH
jgi:hypothetical protein